MVLLTDQLGFQHELSCTSPPSENIVNIGLTLFFMSSIIRNLFYFWTYRICLDSLLDVF